MVTLQRTVSRAIGLTVLISALAAPMPVAAAMDPSADEILKSMSAYLARTAAFTVEGSVALEILTKEGQKLQRCSSSTLVVQRPASFRVGVKGAVADAEFVFDGKTLSLLGKKRNAYVQFAVPGSIDDAIRAIEMETGIPAPGADLLFADPYAVLSSGVESSAYLGTAYVNGIECHHLAFREDQVDWQLWVQTGDAPLPLRYVITSKWQTAAPQYELTLRNWNTQPKLDPAQFTFTAPTGAAKLEAVPADAFDDVQSVQEEK